MKQKTKRNISRIITILFFLAMFIWGLTAIHKWLFIGLWCFLFLVIASIYAMIDEAPEMPDDYDEPFEYKNSIKKL